MILKNSSYKELASYVTETKKKIVIYGAGMIGQTIIPYILSEYELTSYVECFVDRDKRKQGQCIAVGLARIKINSVDYLYEKNENVVILISNSNFMSVVNFLDGIEELTNAEGYIIPLMQVLEWKKTTPITIDRRTQISRIPKKIHYCWFGRREMPKFMKRCLESWKKYCPDYELVLWNEDNYDIEKHVYTKEAYESGKYSFVSDVARLDILYENGGLYFDTDVMLCKNLDNLLYQEGFVGTEKWGNINTGGGCGFVAGHQLLKQLIDYRNNISFIKHDGTLDESTNGIAETLVFAQNGYIPNGALQMINGITIYPPYVTHPYDYVSCETQIEDATVSIHYFCGSWMEESEIKNRQETQKRYSEIINRILVF